MADYEIQRERIVERPVTERVVEREVPTGRRTIVERRGGFAGGFNPVAGLIMVLVAVLLLLLILGVLV
jgi:hypothetical protein